MLVELRDAKGNLLQEPFETDSMPEPMEVLNFAGRLLRRTRLPASRRTFLDDDGIRRSVEVCEVVSLSPPPTLPKVPVAKPMTTAAAA